MSKKFLAVTIVSFFTIVIVGCSSKQEEPKQEGQTPATQTQAAPAQGKMMLVKFGPEDIHAGKGFNVQPDGVSAIWAATENATPTTVFVINEIQLKSSPYPDGKLVTGGVPKNLYAKAGEYSLYLLDTKTNKKSNELKFIVKP